MVSFNSPLGFLGTLRSSIRYERVQEIRAQREPPHSLKVAGAIALAYVGGRRPDCPCWGPYVSVP